MDLIEQQRYEQKIRKRIGETRCVMDNAHKIFAAGDYSGRLSSLKAIRVQERASNICRQRKTQIERLERALSLIAEGKFGSCMNCGAEIPSKILEICPDELNCADCRI